MEILSEQSEKAPEITLDGNELCIMGRSFMSNAYEFYKDIIARIANLDIKTLNVNICIEYFNTSSSKCILELFRVLEKKGSAGADIKINWGYSPNYYEMLEAGEDYRDLLQNVKFEIIEVK